MPVQQLNEGMTWSTVIAILNQLIAQSNSFSTAIGGSLVNGRISYEALENKPTINGVTIVGNTNSEDIAIDINPGSGGNSEPTILARAEQVATSVANQALASKADAEDVEALQQSLADKLSAMPVNIRGIFPSLAASADLRSAIAQAFADGDTSAAGSQILILSADSPNTFSILSFDGSDWQSASVPLNLNGGGVQEVTVRAIADKDGGSQIAAITVDGVTTNIYSPSPQEGTVPIDITFSADPADNRVPSSRCVKEALDRKADLSALQELQETVNEKASQSDLESLTETVGNMADTLADKADTQALENLAEAINGKADKADTYTKQQVDTALAAKAGTAALETLSQTVAAKADKADTYTKQQVDTALADKVSAKQDAANAGKTLVIDSEGNVIPGDPASDGNTLNLGRPQSGFYTLATALAAVPAKKRKGGLCITYMIAENTWETKQYTLDDVSQWTTEGNWKDVSGNKVVIDQDLDTSSDNPVRNAAIAQRIIELENNAVTHIDNSLDTTSTNPVENAAVATAITALQNPSFDADVETVDNGQQVTLSQNGRQVAQFTVSGGGGGPAVQTSRITLNATVSSSKVKEGGHAVLSWYYNHLNADGIADGIVGDITVSIKRGAVTLHEETLSSVSPSEAAHQITLDPWLTTAGTVGVTIRASATDNGTQQSKQFYISVTVVQLSLELNNASALITKAMDGGYADGDTVTIGYTVKGSGTKSVNLYIDGSDSPMSATVTKSGTTNGQFSIAASSLSSGRHTLQLVAENDDLLSESTYIDILKAGASAPFIGLLFTRDDGLTFLGSSHLTPSILATQYAASSFYYFAYDPASTTAVISEYRNNILNQTFSVGRTRQTYTTRYAQSGTVAERYLCGSTEYLFNIVVEASSIDVQKATGYSLELSATGRSNDESNPASWTYAGVTTSFFGFDWKSSGWNGDALVMRNGARILVNALPFDHALDPAASGKTIEMEFKISNVIDNAADIISCISGGKGFRITGSKASMLTGSVVHYNDEDGNPQTRVGGVEKIFASDIDIKLAFVIGRKTENRLMELYVNGTREKADIYDTNDNFVQNSPVGITFDSAAADIELRSIRIYDRALLDDELVDNFIVDRKTVNEMLSKYQENDVLENGLYDITKVLAKGRGAVHFTRPKGLDEVNSANNKKTDFLTDFVYYSPFGPEWDLKIVGCNLRIQGTSSTKYPRKNYRIYLTKPSSAVAYRRDTNGTWTVDDDFSGYIFRSGDREAPLICLKADYSDSSMTLNTGGAKMFDYLMRQLGYLTPPQAIDPDVRQAIDGFPVDVFCTDTDDPTNAVRYYGQYNFNHDKGKSKNIFGHVKLTDEEEVEHNFGASIALEGLNNSNPFCLFQSAGSANSDELADQLSATFDSGFEFNHPEDAVISNIDEGQWDDAKQEWSVKPLPGARAAIKRLFGWIYDCVAASDGVQVGSMSLANPDFGTAAGWSPASRAKWVSAKFKSEVSQYFNVQHLLTYYVFTDYFMSVDQRAKNTILRTWDFLHWYITYYDGDTQLGKRNDSFLAYLYTLTRDTWDSDKSKYAFEGHDSWLWCLVLANLEDELKAAAKAMRNILTNDYVLHMFNVEQQGNWCERAYNKSGEFKYILPATEGVTVIQDGVSTEGVKYPFIYALDGTNNSHRVHTILHRFALLDAKYGCDTFHGDNVEMYLSRLSTDAPGTIVIRSNAPYFFDWNTKNGSHNDPQQAAEGGTVTLTFDGAITVNDPVDLYGASCMERIDLSGVAGSLQNGINLNKAKLLREITASSPITRTQSWFFNFEQCTRLRLIDCTNHVGVKTGTSSSTEFNISNQTRLEVLRLGGTAVQSVELAEGAPILECVLPDTLTVLKLRYLPLLTMQGLSIQGYDSITTLNFANCPNLDWVELASRCPNLDRLRVEGISLSDDGTILARYKNLRGIDADGNAVPRCQLMGDVFLTRFLSDERMAEFREAFPGLNFHLPNYTMIEFDESVSDPANISNLDNQTGYRFDADYAPSGHISMILAQRHRCLAKMSSQGTMTYFPLHDEDGRVFADAENKADCTVAPLDGSQGDVMMFEPHYWYKGINDLLNDKKYACFSSLPNTPNTPDVQVLALSDLEVNEYHKLTIGHNTFNEALSNSIDYNVASCQVSGFKLVRFPTVVSDDGTSTGLGSVFVDAQGNVLSDISIGAVMSNGMYLIAPVPEGATQLYFTFARNVDFDKVVLSSSNNIEDMEPDWVEHDACLVGVAETSEVSGVLRSVMVAAASKGGITYQSFSTYSANRGMQQIDYEMHKDIANLFFARYGTRDSQAQCGLGSSSYTRNMNGTASLGMLDTVNILGSTYYLSANGSRVAISNINCMGYQDLYGDKFEGVDKVRINPSSANGIWRITMPDGSTRNIQGRTASAYIRRVVFGKYMDIVPTGNSGGSDSTYYADYHSYEAATSRVLFRSYYYAYSYGGVTNAYALYTTTYSYAYFGSRLAFRGTLVKAASVEAFKAITAIS